MGDEQSALLQQLTTAEQGMLVLMWTRGSSQISAD